MIDPAEAIQRAILAALKGYTDAGENVFDTVPPADPFPRITIGEIQVLDDSADCYEGSESISTLHVWTRDPPGYPPCKKIVGQIRNLINDEIIVRGHSVYVFDFQGAEYMRDPDGLTSHAVVTFRSLTQPESD